MKLVSKKNVVTVTSELESNLFSPQYRWFVAKVMFNEQNPVLASDAHCVFRTACAAHSQPKVEILDSSLDFYSANLSSLFLKLFFGGKGKKRFNSHSSLCNR